MQHTARKAMSAPSNAEEPRSRYVRWSLQPFPAFSVFTVCLSFEPYSKTTKNFMGQAIKRIELYITIRLHRQAAMYFG